MQIGCAAGLSGRRPADLGGEKGFDDMKSRGSKAFDPGKIQVNDLNGACEGCRGVLHASVADRTIVVVTSIIVVMISHPKGCEKNKAYAEER
ncbi:MAG: hypothetical protein ABSC19_16550 [Syntrophorhabdales bacterium]|jgi:hypothetical protein